MAGRQREGKYYPSQSRTRISDLTRPDHDLCRRRPHSLGILLAGIRRPQGERGLRAKESLEITGLSVNQPVYNAVHTEFTEKMVDEMLYIVRNKKEAPLHLIGHLYIFIDALTRSVRDYRPSADKVKDFYIKEALAFIEHNYMNDISVENIAESSGLNRSYFGKIFKESVGKSPQEFLISYRMIKAAELLRRTRYSVNEIGCAVGYPNQLHFSRAFKSVYGVSPRNWRNANTPLTEPDIDYK